MRPADPAALHTLHGQTMGTSWTVRLANPQFLPLEPIQARIETALALVVQQMSNWQADSGISRWNAAPAGTWQTFPPECFTVLTCAMHWAQASGGAWDPTVGPLVNLWGFGPRAHAAFVPQHVPDAAALTAARAQVGYQRILLDCDARCVLQPGTMQLDLCGIAKGYAVDLVAQTLLALGLKHFLVEIGGELRTSGQRPDGQPWRVAIAPGSETAPCTLTCHKPLSIATSGEQWHAFEVAGRRYSHTIDPRSGWPVAHDLVCVTVVHAECMQADALATVLTVLGTEQGLAFAKTNGIAARLCQHTSAGLVTYTTAAFTALTTP